VTVPTNSTLTIYKQNVMIHPIIDEYYSQLPSHNRSARLARDKGQMTMSLSADGDTSSSGSGLVQQSTTTLINGVDARLQELEVRTAQLEVR